jgi:hypothetical protein
VENLAHKECRVWARLARKVHKATLAPLAFKAQRATPACKATLAPLAFKAQRATLARFGQTFLS